MCVSLLLNLEVSDVNGSFPSEAYGVIPLVSEVRRIVSYLKIIVIKWMNRVLLYFDTHVLFGSLEALIFYVHNILVDKS